MIRNQSSLQKLMSFIRKNINLRFALSKNWQNNTCSVIQIHKNKISLLDINIYYKTCVLTSYYCENIHCWDFGRDKKARFKIKQILNQHPNFKKNYSALIIPESIIYNFSLQLDARNKNADDISIENYIRDNMSIFLPYEKEEICFDFIKKIKKAPYIIEVFSVDKINILPVIDENTVCITSIYNLQFDFSSIFIKKFTHHCTVFIENIGDEILITVFYIKNGSLECYKATLKSLKNEYQKIVDFIALTQSNTAVFIHEFSESTHKKIENCLLEKNISMKKISNYTINKLDKKIFSTNAKNSDLAISFNMIKFLKEKENIWIS